MPEAITNVWWMDRPTLPKKYVFPKVPQWDGINNTQIISPVDNPEEAWTYGRTNNHLDRITRLFPRATEGSVEKREEPQREVIWLTGIVHRNPFWMIDFFNTFNSKYWATFTFFDNPKATYNLDRIADQVIDYLGQLVERDSAKEFVICGASAGEMLSRRVYEKLNTEKHKHILPHIKHHFSVCWISTYEELSGPQKIVLSIANSPMGPSFGKKLAKHLAQRINTTLDGWLTKIAWDVFLAPVNHKNSEILQWIWGKRHHSTQFPQQGERLNKAHRERWAISLTEAHRDIFRTITDQKYIAQRPQNTPPATILYSSNDRWTKWTYADPQKNARVGASFYNRANIVQMYKWWHVDVVFQSEKYLEPMRAELDKIWTASEKEWQE